MKKQLLVLSGLFMLFSAHQVQAQAVTNGGFETWVSAPTFELPVVSPAPVFNSSNDESFYQSGSGVLTVTKVAGVSGNAIRIENKTVNGGQLVRSYVSWGNADQGIFDHGVP